MKRTLSRMISVVVTLAMVISLLAVPASALTWDNVSETRYASRYVTSNYTTGKFYDNMTKIPLTGDGARDVVAVAASQVGYIEGSSASGYNGEVGGSNNYTEYGCFLGLTGGSGHAWCAAFCAWSFYVAEVTDLDGSQYDTEYGNIWADAYVPYWSEYLINQGRYKAAYQFRNTYSDLYDASYVPQPGDLVFFYTASGDYPGWEGHIGLVAYSDGTYVYTLEGNTSSQDGVESEGGGMFFKKYDLKGSSLVGFGDMPYETVAGLPEIDYTGANPTPGLYVTTSGSKSVYQNIDDSTASWTLPMSSVFEVQDIATSSDGTVMLYSKCEINGSTVYGWIAHGSDSNGYTKTLQIYASGEAYEDPNDLDKDGIPDSYGVTIEEDGTRVFDNSYGFTFKIDDTNGTIEGEDATLITTASAYESCNPNWAISVQLRPTGNDSEYEVVKVVECPGSASAAGISLQTNDVILVVHSADSQPGTYTNWMSKVAAVALKEGDILTFNSTNTTATVSQGEAADPTEPVETEPVETEPAETEPVETEPAETEPVETEPVETEPAETEPVETEPVETEPAIEVPDYGGLIPGAGQQGYAGNLYYGVDISYHNVNDTSYHNYETDDDSGADYSLLDFEAMKASGCDYVIIRIGSEDSYGKFIDPHFLTMYNLAREAGMDIGLYFYSLALTYDEAVEDAEFVLDYLEQYDFSFEYPVYIDIEEEDQLALSTTELDAIAYGWCDTMVDAGYFPGIYTGYYASQTMSTQLKSDYDMWIAAYTTGVGPDDDNLSSECSMWQYTSTGTGNYEGIGKDDIDMNVCYKDYPAIMAAGGYNNFEVTEPEETEPVETEPVETEPVETKPVETEPVETEPAVTEPAIEVPDYGGLIPGAGIPGTLSNPAANFAFGCDLSFYNVNDTDYRDYITNDDSGADYSLVDFQAMKASGCDFVILRMGASDDNGYYTDPHFYTYYNLAREAGMDIGVYFYSYAMSTAEAIEEAEYVIDILDASGMYFEYPIYIDIEEADQIALGSSAVSAIAKAWCETMYENGYFPGIYGAYNLFNLLTTEMQEGYDLWLAYISNTDGSVPTPETDNISDDAGIWQFTFEGQDRFEGIGREELDVNVSYKDYASIMKAYGYNNVPTTSEPTEPEVTEPEVTEPEVTEPEVTEPEVTEPEVTDPDADGDGILDCYGVYVEDGIYAFTNSYGYVFDIDDVNGTIDGEDATIITTSSYYNNCNPNWAISVHLRLTGTSADEYEVVKVVECPGSAAAAGISLQSGDVILVVHSAASYPGDYENWMDKIAAVALKEGDIIEIATDNKSATVYAPVVEEPEVTEPVETEPVETEPVETEPVETEPVETEPVETEPVETDPVETEPVETEPEVTDPDADGDGILDCYGVYVEDGIYAFTNSYGYVFDIDDVNGTIEGEDATIITTSSYYSSCNPNWAISVQLRPTDDGRYQVVKVVECPGSASAAGISLESGDVIMVVHSAASYPGDYENWMSKIAAVALKKGDILEIASDNSTVTVISAGELEEPEVTEPEVTVPDADVPNYGGVIAGAGIPGSADNLYYGCDVSFYNVSDNSYANYTTSDDSGADYSLLDFNKMKADGCDFVILRMGSSDSSGYYTDPHFFTLYNMARAAGMDIGLYFYSYAMSESEAIEEAEYVIDVIEDNGMYFEYPIYIDIEESDQLALSETVLSNICYGWCDTMAAAGYFPGVYGNYNLYDAVNTNIKNDYDFWVAWVSSATSQSAYNPSTNNISNECGMWQYSFYGYEYDGVGLDMLDVNVSYKDYPAIMAACGYNNVN